MLAVYLDESDDGEYVCVGGVIVPRAVTTRLETQWHRVLKRTGVACLHMRELTAFRGQFEGWTEDRRQTLLEGLTDTLKGSALTLVGAAAPWAGWNDLTRSQQWVLKSPYYPCFDWCVQAGFLRAELGDGGTVNAVVAERPKFTARLALVWAEMRKGSEFRHRMGAITYDVPMNNPLLQLADFVVWELRKNCREHYRGRQRATRKSLQALMMVSEPPAIRFLDADYLRRRADEIPSEMLENVERFLAQRSSKPQPNPSPRKL